MYSAKEHLNFKFIAQNRTAKYAYLSEKEVKNISK